MEKVSASSRSAAPERTRSGRYYQPQVDIAEMPQELVLVADVPGAKPEEIDIRYDDGELTIHARVQPRQEPTTHYLLREYGVGDYFRSFRLSEQIDANRIRAEYHAGVLRLHLPKVEAARPRKIPVNVTA